MCRIIRRCSRVWVGGIILRYEGVPPHCVVVNIYRVYVAVIRVPNPTTRIVIFDQLNSEMRMVNSPIRLIVGGMAMLAKLASSHHRLIKGYSNCMFRANNSVRLWIRS